MTGFNSRYTPNEKEKYNIEFYTDKKEYYNFIECACRICIDIENKKVNQPIFCDCGCHDYFLETDGKKARFICKKCGRIVKETVK